MNVRKPATGPAGDTASVEEFMVRLKHPLKDQIEAVRRIVRGVSPEIAEAIKWNAPSFRTTEFFATINLRSLERVQLIFHLGAKVRNDIRGMKIKDPAGLIKWLAKDRCVVTVGDVAIDRTHLAAIVRQWIKYVKSLGLADVSG